MIGRPPLVQPPHLCAELGDHERGWGVVRAARSGAVSIECCLARMQSPE